MPKAKATGRRPGPARPTLGRSPSEQLAAIIRARGLTAYQVGALAGIDHCGLAHFLRGERDLRLATLDRIAEALGLDLVERSRGRGRPSAGPETPAPPQSSGPAETVVDCGGDRGLGPRSSGGLPLPGGDSRGGSGVPDRDGAGSEGTGRET